MLIFRSSRSQLFFKIGALKNLARFTGKHLCWPLQAFFYRPPTVAASGFDSRCLFSAESGIYSWQVHRFSLRTSLKTRVKSQKQSLEVLQISQKKTCVEVYFLYRSLFLTTLLKGKFSCGIYKIFKNTERLLPKPVLSPGLPFLITYTSGSN